MAWHTRIVRILGALVLIALLAVGIVWTARVPLLVWLCETALSRMGFGPAQVEVRALGLQHASMSLRASALGTIERIEVDYHWQAGFGPAVRKVQLGGARLHLRSGDGGAFGVPGAGDETSAVALPPMAVALDDVRLVLPVRATMLELEVSGSLASGAQPEAQLAFTLRASQGELHGRLTAATPPGGLTDVALTVADGAFDAASFVVRGLSGSLQARTDGRALSDVRGDFTVKAVRAAQQAWGAGTLAISQPSAQALAVDLKFAPLALTLRTALPFASVPRPYTLDARCDARCVTTLLPGIEVASGALNLAAAGELPVLPFVPADWLQSGRLTGTARMDAHAVTVKGLARADTVAGTLSCALGAGTLSCVPAKPWTISGVVLAKDAVAEDSALAGLSSLQLSAIEQQPLLVMAQSGQEARLALAARLALRGRQLSVDAPLKASLTVDSVSTPDARHGRYTLQAVIDAEHPPGKAWFAPRFKFEGHYTLDAAQHLRALAVDAGSVDLPTQGWAASAWHGSYRAGETDTIELSIGDLRSTRDPSVLVPLMARLSARRSAALVTFNASVADAAHALELSLTGRQQRSEGKGEARFALKPITLAGRESLTALVPALAERISAASGAIKAWGEAHWGAGAPRSELSLRLENVTLGTPAASISGLNAALDLDGLAPLHSGPGQRLQAILELPGLKRVPLTARYSIDRQTLRFEQLRAEVFDGAFTVRDGSVDIASGVTQLDLEVHDVDLASAFTILNLDQVKGSGRLSGRLPLRYEGGHIAVLGGRLAAGGPGVVQIGASELTDTLKGRGKDVDLALRALSDFHYRELAISADKPLSGAGRALFHLEGNNPAVMEAQPFIFNISLETDFDYLAGVLLDLSGLTNSALGWGAGALLKQ